MRTTMLTVFSLLLVLLALAGCARQKAVVEPLVIPQVVKPQHDAPSPAREVPTKTENNGLAPAETAKESPVLPSPIRDEPVAPAPPGNDADPAGARKKASVSLERIYFPFGKATLDDEALKALERLYQTLDHRTPYRLEGYCDERGAEDYNLALSEARARAVLAWLVQRGMPAGLISFIGYGLEYPADHGTTEAAYARNRRVEAYPATDPTPESRGR